VRTDNGLSVPVTKPPRVRADVVLVPALAQMMPATLSAALAKDEVADALHMLAACASNTLIGAACTGTFVLAEGGLLDGRPATTTWWLAPLFRERYPNVTLDTSKIVVPAGNRVTAGAAISHVDLALWIIRQQSAQLATLTARYFLVEERASQARYVLPDRVLHADALVRAFESWTREHIAEPFSLERAASAIGTSERTLARRVRAVFGRPPLKFVQDIRAQKAIELLSDGNISIETAACAVGYTNASTLRVVLRKRLGVGVRDLRVLS